MTLDASDRLSIVSRGNSAKEVTVRRKAPDAEKELGIR